MVISLSVVVLLLILAWIFLRSGGLKFSHAVVCVLLGFYLASSSMATTIHDGLTATANVVSSLKP
ncbi:hypothetical protein J7E99_11705 [Streptomyces sp. ISL-44]|uniref:hypothetical protein n=1 Tax=unclassified Streptomyces TaxID=2593676 RepID=UPI001BE6FDCE|nr:MULTISPECIES: hypothetical protein [unclassified Streptomyces]MBT2541356.1 hypothetical protein [Streptomyces sp. ISL-44]MCX5016109.1 hypothetical protein [Streptomyces sp. NBC_00555]MCX5609259.1 hypothetical protein [Streptomyces sp. NBC_00047]UUU43189.1 hypothetical protein JIW86_32870 [Streptomyces sp. NBC_00162]